jgi:hypothetical protein
MRTLPTLALIWLVTACASAPPMAPGIAGTYDLVSVDGRPLPSEDNIVDGMLQLRGNRTFSWRFTMQEVSEEGERTLAPIVFEGRFAVDEGSPVGLRIRLTRRDRASSTSGNEEEIEGTLEGDSLSFTSEELTAVFRRRG